MAIDSAFTLLSVTHTYEVLDSKWMSIRTSHIFELEAIRAHRFYFREYFWHNERGIEKPPQVTSGQSEAGVSSHRLHGPVATGPEGYRLAVLDLGRIVEPGETETVKIEHFFVRVDPDKDGLVGELAKAGARAIHLKAILPSRPDLRTHYASRHATAGDESWLEWEDLTPQAFDDRRVAVSKSVQDPQQNVRYRICWDQNTDVV